jgi:hypothetical protein
VACVAGTQVMRAVRGVGDSERDALAWFSPERAEHASICSREPGLTERAET